MKTRVYLLFTIAVCLFVSTNTIAQNKAPKQIYSNEVHYTINELLQGKWQSLDDKTNFLIFDSNLRKEIGGGMNNWNIEAFIVSNKCLNEGDKDIGIELEANKYISCDKSDMCWYIVTVNEVNLTLSYMGRGNELRYKRVK